MTGAGDQQTAFAFPAMLPCLPWHLRFLSPQAYQHGGQCGYCQAEIAAPKGATRPACLYCAMEHGVVPMAEPHDPAAAPACFENRTVDLFGLVGTMTNA